MAAIPRLLLRKRDEFARELAMLDVQAQTLRERLALRNGTIRLLEPAWKAPKAIPKRRPTHRGPLPAGQAAKAGILVLKRAGQSLATADIVRTIEKEKGLQFASKKDREDFASSITMAMRRYEKRGLVTSEPVGKSRARRWRLTLG